MASEESREEVEKEEYAASGGGLSDVAAKLQEIDQEDSSLLDSALGEGEGDGEVEGDESALSLLDQDETGEGDGDGDQLEDPEIEAIKARVKEMEEEAEKLKEMQGEVEKQLMGSKPAGKQFPTPEEKQEADLRSVFVGNVDFQSTAEELGQHFHGCGPVNRVTILCDKYSGHPKGFAYIEFAEKDAVNNALALDESLFRGRQIKVTAKRTNKPGLNRGRGRGRGRGMFRGGMMMGFNPYFGGYMVRMPSRGRGRGFRGRAKSNWYAPY